METIALISIFLIIIILANVAADIFPKVPWVLWQILGGIGLASVPFFPTYNQDFDPSFFMMLVAAPLLFYEGQKTPFKSFTRNFSAILNLSGVYGIVTIIFVMLAGNRILDWPLPILLILAAIVTPTDATALISTTYNLKLPNGVKKALSLESLFNDATGLVALELGLIWLQTGNFSFRNAIVTFLISAIGGALVGFIGGQMIIAFRRLLVSRRLNERLSQVLIQIGTPVVIYLLAEELHVSGIIAVVIAGLLNNYEQNTLQLTSPKVESTVNTVWTLVSDFLNAVVFIFLGFEMTRIAIRFTEDHIGIANLWSALIAAIAIYIVMFILRMLLISRTDSRNILRLLARDKDRKLDAQVFAFGGVHGSVAIAMAFSLPYLINGKAFEYRDRITLIVALVVIVSLLVPMFGLKRFVPEIEPDFTIEEMTTARNKMLKVGLKSLRSQELNPRTREVAIKRLRRQVEDDNAEDSNRRIWREYATKIYKVRNEAVQSAIKKGELSPEATELYTRISQITEPFMNQHLIKKILFILKFKIKAITAKKLFESQNSETMGLIQRNLLRTQKRVEYLDKRWAEYSSNPDGTISLSAEKEIDSRKWLALFKEINKVSESAVDDYLKAQVKDKKIDLSLAQSLRGLVIRDSNEWRSATTSDKQINLALLTALEHETTWLANQRDEKLIGEKLGQELYEDLSASRHLIKATIDGFEE
ncbi:MAG: sodium:proton antiporter [Lactobacillaceae bacterium]|jgi:CPA1 family monovalent cation:H+ antiporter|nr:sodium:proton antiporter [Lactobacillaceae bacterium]